MPATVRVMLILIQILNYFCVGAMFTPTNETDTQGCFSGLCLRTDWWLGLVGKTLITQLVYTPAIRIM